MRRMTKEVTTDGSGDVTVLFPKISGKIHQIEYVADGVAAFANTADITITGNATGVPILSQSNVSAGFVKAPRQATHGADGAASLYAGSGTPVQDRIAIANDQVKVVVAQGGAAKKGKFHILVD